MENRRENRGGVPELDPEQVRALQREFADLLERLQTPEAREGMRQAFAATPEELGRAAVEEAKRQSERRG